MVAAKIDYKRCLELEYAKDLHVVKQRLMHNRHVRRPTTRALLTMAIEHYYRYLHKRLKTFRYEHKDQVAACRAALEALERYSVANDYKPKGEDQQGSAGITEAQPADLPETDQFDSIGPDDLRRLLSGDP
jgi:hypothetical protein